MSSDLIDLNAENLYVIFYFYKSIININKSGNHT